MMLLLPTTTAGLSLGLISKTFPLIRPTLISADANSVDPPDYSN